MEINPTIYKKFKNKVPDDGSLEPKRYNVDFLLH